MEKDIAVMIAATAARCSKEIGDLAILVKTHCEESERETLSAAIGSAVFELRDGLMGAVFNLQPALKAEFDHRIQKFGRSYY